MLVGASASRGSAVVPFAREVEGASEGEGEGDGKGTGRGRGEDLRVLLLSTFTDAAR